MSKWKYRMNSEEEQQEFQHGGIPLMLNLGGMGNEYMQPPAGIRVVENQIFFYGEIDESSMLDLNRVLVDNDIKAQNTRNILGDSYDPVVHLHLSTYGGSVFAAFSTVDTIRRMKSKVYTYVDGNVASAGTLITAVGNKRYVGLHSNMLIHQLSSGMYGKYAELEDEMVNLASMMKTLKEFYKKYTKLPMKKIDEILKKDIWLSAQECVDYGLADEIL